MSTDLLEFLEEDPDASSLSMNMNFYGTAFISVLPSEEIPDRTYYILEPNESGIKNAEMINS